MVTFEAQILSTPAEEKQEHLFSETKDEDFWVNLTVEDPFQMSCILASGDIVIATLYKRSLVPKVVTDANVTDSGWYVIKVPSVPVVGISYDVTYSSGGTGKAVYKDITQYDTHSISELLYLDKTNANGSSVYIENIGDTTTDLQNNLYYTLLITWTNNFSSPVYLRNISIGAQTTQAMSKTMLLNATGSNSAYFRLKFKNSDLDEYTLCDVSYNYELLAASNVQYYNTVEGFHKFEWDLSIDNCICYPNDGIVIESYSIEASALQNGISVCLMLQHTNPVQYQTV